MNKEKPIIFSTPMIKALLNTKPGAWPPEAVDPSKPFKSQTRRVIKQRVNEFENGLYIDRLGGVLNRHRNDVKIAPYEKGDILWVRETWRVSGIGIDGGEEWATVVFKHGKNKTVDINNTNNRLFYGKARWKPSIHMPREAARIFLEVKSVRVERLQDISENDALSEGVESLPTFAECGTYRRGFEALWDSINAKHGYSWESNPWVWVYEFMRTE